MMTVKVLSAGGRSLVAYLFLVGYLLGVGAPAVLVSVLTGSGRHLFPLGIFAAKAMRRLLGIRLVVEGAEHLDRRRPTVYCFNHESQVDPPIMVESLASLFPDLGALYKAELDAVPVLGRAMRLAGFVPVHRRDRTQAMAAVDLAVARLQRGASFMLAPEGTRSEPGTLKPFKKGAFVMAIKAGVPVVPVALLGTGRLMPRGQWYVRRGTVTVRVGEPIATDRLTMEDRDHLSEEVRRHLAMLLGDRPPV